MAKITRSGGAKVLTAEDVASIFQASQRGSLSSYCSSNESYNSRSSFWESSDTGDRFSLSGYSSESDSELVSDCSSDYAMEDEAMKLSTKRKQLGHFDDLPSKKRKIEMSDSDLEDDKCA